MYIHPEVKPTVYKEYARLSKKFPGVSDEFKMTLALKMVKRLCRVTTARVLKEMAYVR